MLQIDWKNIRCRVKMILAAKYISAEGVLPHAAVWVLYLVIVD
jgi:hypothetical protein